MFKKLNKPIIKKCLNLIAGFFIILSFLLLGRVIQAITNVPIPGSVLGLLLLFSALSLRLISLSIVQPASNTLLKYLTLFFVPAGVGLINYLDILMSHGITIIISSFVSTITLLLTVGLTYQKINREHDDIQNSSDVDN